MTCVKQVTATESETAPDWDQLHWITTGNNSTGTIFIGGVNIPNGTPIAPQDCGTFHFINFSYLGGDVDSLHTVGTLTFNDPGTFNVRCQVRIFSISTEPNQRPSLRITTDLAPILVDIPHADWALLGVGDHNFDFVLPANCGHVFVNQDNSIFAPGLGVSYRLFFLNL